MLLFHVRKRHRLVSDTSSWTKVLRFAGRRQVRQRQVLRLDVVSTGEQYTTLNHIPQFSNVSGPAVRLHFSDRRGRKSRDFSTCFLAELCQKMLRDFYNIFETLAKWWNINLYDQQTKEKIAAKVAFVDFFF